ncbi:MAG: MBL fold metallo-hydrolase [Pseudomonadota bacterium]|nr:MBL fold metallo-hydrolase [Pseudomonadota bacterium]
MQTVDSGALRLTIISESTGAAFPPNDLFPEFSPDVFDEAPIVGGEDYYHAEKGKLVSSIHSWMFRLGSKLVLVDTGLGRRKDRGPQEAPFFLSLAEAGVSPEDVDLVVLTHLHTDHIKNNTIAADDGWVPAFPNARYVAGRREYEHWQPGGAGISLYPEQTPILEETVAPLVKAGCLDLIEDETEILPGLRTLPVPGHTATQLALLLDDGSQTYLMAADSIHHPLQVHRPHWGSALCEDGQTAYRTRMSVLEHCSDTGAVLMPSHFAGTRAGMVHRDAGGFRFEPAAIAAPVSHQPVSRLA